MPALFHLLFKVRRLRPAACHRACPPHDSAEACAANPPQTLALAVYLFGTWFSSSFVNVFVACVLLLAFDFWTVKNVSGRLMVGLRWWSEVNEDGSTTWKFEAQEVRHGGQPSPCGGPRASRRAARARAG